MPDLAEFVRTHAQRLQDPSPRTPTRSTDFNDADKLERHLREDGHRLWGWLIYRCTYASDEQWKAFMDRLNFYIDETLEFHGGMDMKASLDVTVIENQELFDGATPATVRHHFRQWAETAAEIEQGGVPALRSQRYRYCLHVDQVALESVINGRQPPDDALDGSFVNLVVLTQSDITNLDPAADKYWMRINYAFLMVTWYNLFRKYGVWDSEYREPPQVGRP